LSDGRNKGRGTGRAGMRDVARIAGVSPITVSRALVSPTLVSVETLKRVRAAIEATGYIPNRVAGSLSSSRTRMIGAVVPTLRNSIAADFIEGMSDVLRAQSYNLLLGNSGFSVDEEEALVLEFLAHQADGIYLTGTTHTPRTREVLRRGKIPTVEIAALPDDPIDLAVGFSNVAAAAAMTRHLAGRGYRRVAFFSPLTKDNERQVQRLSGYRAAAAECGLDLDPGLVAEMPMDLAGAARELEALLARRPDVDAVFCTSDILAMGVLFECQRLGIAVPEKLAIAGFENLEIAAKTQPGLTTVHIPRYEIGSRAAEMLLDRIAGRHVHERLLDLGYTIVARQTTR
jgi:LacI family transcriptional regulator, gluconate utilization system Gnt-I transcriptional repressor